MHSPNFQRVFWPKNLQIFCLFQRDFNQKEGTNIDTFTHNFTFSLPHPVGFPITDKIFTKIPAQDRREGGLCPLGWRNIIVSLNKKRMEGLRAGHSERAASAARSASGWLNLKYVVFTMFAPPHPPPLCRILLGFYLRWDYCIKETVARDYMISMMTFAYSSICIVFYGSKETWMYVIS